MTRRPPKSTIFPYPTLFRVMDSAPIVGVQKCAHACDVAFSGGRDCGGVASRHASTQGLVSPLPPVARRSPAGSEEHTSELQSRQYLVCRLLLDKQIYRMPSS